MRFHIGDTDRGSLDRAVAFYGEHGYLLLDGLDESLTPRFHDILAGLLDLEPEALGPILDASHAPEKLPAEHLQRLSKVETPAHLKTLLLAELEPLLVRALGAFVHVSSDYHVQFKSGVQYQNGRRSVVDHGGFRDGYVEVQGIHMQHQDFCGARLPTSPSGITLWVPLNDCDDWNLRVFPGAHRRGLLHNKFLTADDPRLLSLAEPLDIRARRGSGAIFHALMPHGSTHPAATRRVSCDIRFFPLTSFLPSQVHTLTRRPFATHRAGLERAEGDTLRAPFLEALAFLGQDLPRLEPREHSVLNWVDYLMRLREGDRLGARRSFERFVNEGFGVDGVSAYERFFAQPQRPMPLVQLRHRLSQLEPERPELPRLDRHVADLILAEWKAGRIRSA